MPRQARIVIPGIPHHVTHRGIRGERIFHSDNDHQRYLAMLKEYSAEHSLSIAAYCLMPNHIHLVVVPAAADSLSATLEPLQMRYTQYLNAVYHGSGTRWDNRFYSCPCDDSHFWCAIRYVEQNPLRCGTVQRAQLYPWSSAAGHCGLRPDPLLWTETTAVHQAQWADWLTCSDEEMLLRTLRSCTSSGRPAGDEGFRRRVGGG